jgi:hypothetical protein
MNRVILVSIALIIVYFILSKSEMYMDTAQRYTRTDVGNRVAEPFMTCSPESFDECKKAKMPHLSRY